MMKQQADAKAGEICDFCGAQGVVIAWPVPEIRGVASDGSQFVAEQGTWATCAECRPFVEAHDMDGLATRSAIAYGMDTRARNQIRALYVLIDQVRGNAVPVAAWREWVR